MVHIFVVENVFRIYIVIALGGTALNHSHRPVRPHGIEAHGQAILAAIQPGGRIVAVDEKESELERGGLRGSSKARAQESIETLDP